MVSRVRRGDYKRLRAIGLNEGGRSPIVGGMENELTLNELVRLLGGRISR